MAEATCELKFNSAGFQQVLNSGGTRWMLYSAAANAVARMDGMASLSSFTGTHGKYGPRPIFVVHAQRYPDPIRQHIVNHMLEGAL